MIKLKKLLEESNVWRTPPGTPDEVIEVIHRIISALTQRLGRKIDPVFFY